MIQSPVLKRRAQTSPPLLASMIRAARSGCAAYNILFSDQLAPDRSRRSPEQVVVEAPGSDISYWVLSLCALCPPASDSLPVAQTMAPDERDRNEHPPEKIGRQWMSLVQSQPGWESVRFKSTDRRAMYLNFGTYHARIRTSSTQPYGNLALRVNPSASQALASLPLIFAPEIFGVLSSMGHSDRVIVIPASSPEASNLRFHFESSGLPLFDVNASVGTIATELSRLWVPDLHAQQANDPVQKPFGYFTPASKADFQLDGTWADTVRWQSLSAEAFKKAAFDDPSGLLLIASSSEQEHCLFVNGVSGANGGF